MHDTLFTTNTSVFLPKLYGIYTSIDEIDFSKLPQSFVLKTNHDCGGVMVVSNKKEFLADSVQYQALKEKFAKHLATNYYDLYREWHYKDIEPRIFAEELLGEGLHDYRFHCFGGVVHFIQVANSTHTNNDIFDTKWNRLAVTYLNPQSQITPAQPLKLDCMLEIAQKLSLPLNYVRVDLYCVQEKIFVGELTFTPNGGTARFEPQTYDKELGALWHND